MQNQEMDMNNVMYPEISSYDEDEMENMDMEGMNHQHQEQQDIVTLNYTMLRAPEKQVCLKDQPES